MSQVNTEIVRRGYAAFNEGDVGGLLAFAHDDVVWHEAPQVPGAKMYVGREETRGYLDSISRYWETPRFDPEDVHVAGDAIVVLARFSGRGRQSGAEVSTEVAHMFRFRDTRVYRVVTYLDHGQAIAALNELRERLAKEG